MKESLILLAWMSAAAAASAATLPENRAPQSTGVLENYRLVCLKRVYFDSGQAELRPEDKGLLEHMAGHYRPEQFVVEVRGYTDEAEAGNDAQALSSNRAAAVAALFTIRGIPLNRVRVLGLGEIAGAGPAANGEHRRVDIRVFASPAERPRILPTSWSTH